MSLANQYYSREANSHLDASTLNVSMPQRFLKVELDLNCSQVERIKLVNGVISILLGLPHLFSVR